MEEESFISSLYTIVQSKTDETHQTAKLTLDSITESIQFSNYPASSHPTLLFASLLSLLSKSSSSSSLPSLLFLLHKTIPKTASPVIQSKSMDTINLMDLIYKRNENSIIIGKYVIAITIQILTLIPKNELESEKGLGLISFLLQKLIDDKKEIRRQAGKSLVGLLERNDVGNKIMVVFREFIMKCVQSEGKEIVMVSNFIIQAGQKLTNDIVGDIAYHLSKSLKKIDDEETCTHIYLILESLLSNSSISSDLTEDLLKDLLHSPPSFYSSEKLIFSFFQALTQSLFHLSSLDYINSKKYLSSVFSLCTELLLVENNKFHLFAQKTFEMIFLKTINDDLYNEDLNFLLPLEIEENSDGKNREIKKIAAVLKYMLSSRFEGVRGRVLGIIGAFFERVGEGVFAYVKELLIEIKDTNNDKNQKTFTNCFGKVVQSISLGNVLQILPIDIKGDPLSDGFEDENNLWLLPILMHHLKETDFSLFFDYFFKLLNQLKNLEQDPNLDKLKRKIYSSIERQIWQIFPFFNDTRKQGEGISTFLDKVILTLADVEKEENLYLIKGLNAILTTPNFNMKLKGIFSTYSEKLIPKITKLIKPIRDQRSKIALSCISSLSKLAPEDYLDRVFEKNATKFLQFKPEDKKNLSQLSKDFEILLSIMPSVILRSHKWELTTQLAKKFIPYENFLQKRAYRLLLIAIDGVHESFYPEIIEIFLKHRNVMSTSRFLRLGVLKKLWLAKKMNGAEFTNLEEIGEFLQNFLAEVLITLKEPNRKARKMANDVFVLMSDKMQSLGVLKEFLSMIAAGLAGGTSLMKADTILAINKIYDKFGKELDPAYLLELQNLIFLLLNDKNRETFNAILTFLRTLPKILDKGVFLEQLPSILKSLFEIDESSKDLFRSKIRHLLAKYIKKFGRDIVEKAMPEEHAKFIRAIVKTEKNEVKKRKEAKRKAKESNEFKKSKKNLNFDGMEEEEQEERRNKKDKEDDFGVQYQVMEEENEDANNLLLKYDMEKERFHFVEHPLAKIKEKIKKEEIIKKNRDLDLVKGKIIVKEMKTKEITGKKRRREDTNDVKEDKKEVTFSQKANMLNRISNAINHGHVVKESGETFKAKSAKTKGDLAIKGKPNPYAFIQLNPSVLNKRYRNAAGKSLETVISQKKSGSLKGLREKKVKLN